MKWNGLTMKERSDLMGLFLKSGVGSLSDMKHIYDGESDTEYNGGTLKESKVSAKLSRNQWNDLYRKGKVSLSEIPREYQSWIEGENSEFKKGITKAISDFGENYVAPVMMTASSLNPVLGASQDIAEIAFNLGTGNLAGAGTAIATAALPNMFNNIKIPIKRSIGTFVDKYRKNILGISEKINPKYKAWLENPSQKTLDAFNSYASEQVLDAAKRDMLTYHATKDLEFGMKEGDIPYSLYNKYIMNSKSRPAGRLETIINNLGATQTNNGRISAMALYSPSKQTMVFYDKGLKNKTDTRGIMYHELNHGAQNALREASRSNSYKGRKPVKADKELAEFLQNNSTYSNKWANDIEEFNSEMQYIRGGFEQFGGFNTWSPEIQIKAQDYLAKRFGITPDDAGYILDYMDKNFHKNGGKLKKK